MAVALCFLWMVVDALFLGALSIYIVKRVNIIIDQFAMTLPHRAT